MSVVEEEWPGLRRRRPNWQEHLHFSRSRTIRRCHPCKECRGNRAVEAGNVVSRDTPEQTLRSVKEVSSLLGESINQVRRGEIDPRIANAVGYLSAILLKALEQGEIEERLSKIEAALAKEKGSGQGGIDESKPDKAN